jgi:hypothetical protein
MAQGSSSLTAFDNRRGLSLKLRPAIDERHSPTELESFELPAIEACDSVPFAGHYSKFSVLLVKTYAPPNHESFPRPLAPGPALDSSWQLKLVFDTDDDIAITPLSSTFSEQKKQARLGFRLRQRALDLSSPYWLYKTALGLARPILVATSPARNTPPAP